MTNLITPAAADSLYHAEAPQELFRSSDLIRATRPIHLLVLHCSATRNCDTYTPEQLLRDHLARGFHGCGYHYYITRQGRLFAMRPVDRIGAHVRGHNSDSIGICYEGGLDHKYEPCDTRTPMQRQTLSQLLHALLQLYPHAFVLGHRDLSPDRNGDGRITSDEWVKVCPCFDARVYNEYNLAVNPHRIGYAKA